MPLAIGTDTAGSIRNPASACGVVGLKPTYGLVPRDGVFPLAATLDHVGPMARSVDDVAVLLGAMADRQAQPQRHETVQSAVDLGGLRVGYVRSFHERDMPADPEVATALDSVAKGLAEAGATVSTVELPDLNSFSQVSRIILQAEGWTTHASWLREQPESYGKSTRLRLLPGAFLTAEDYVRSQRSRRVLLAAVQEVFREVDVLLCASAMDPACRLDDQAELSRTYPRQARTPFNVTGHPALAMMAGLSRSGMPLSVQFAGRYFEEATVLRVARAWERIGSWQDRHPAALERVSPLNGRAGARCGNHLSDVEIGARRLFVRGRLFAGFQEVPQKARSVAALQGTAPELLDHLAVERERLGGGGDHGDTELDVGMLTQPERARGQNLAIRLPVDLKTGVRQCLGGQPDLHAHLASLDQTDEMRDLLAASSRRSARTASGRLKRPTMPSRTKRVSSSPDIRLTMEG